MLKRIRLHNYLNGHVFSLIEYLLVAAILTPFLFYYVAHGWALYALAAAGIVFNCFTVCAVALVSILAKEQSVGLRRFARDRELRRRVAIEHPNLSSDTLILSVTVLIPFWIFGATLIDLAPRRL